MRLLRPLLVGLALAALGCNQVDYIEIKPDNLVLRQRNNEIWLQGHAKSHTGVHYSKTKVSWSVKDPSVATVDETGKLRALKSGKTEVVARVGKVTAAAPVEVLFAEKMVVSPESLQLVEGGPSVELKVKVFDYQGRELKDRTPIFRSLNNEVVSMGQNAAFAVAAGASSVEVLVEELKHAIPVTVEAAKTK